METTDILDQKSSTLEVTENAKAYLSTAASWAKFWAIIMFIGVGFIALCGLLIITVGSSLPSMWPSGYFTLTGLFYVGFAVIMFFPALYLLRFSQKTQEALANNDAQVLAVSFQNMKSYWKFIGILSIIVIALCIIFIPIVAITSAVAAF
ncbi:MAG: hypothetical protein LBE13_13465 [Bacteroidales bacterium]|jgi:hypothetical protein|nr:hypothetical protein [Bacteroidales bacterium]